MNPIVFKMVANGAPAVAASFGTVAAAAEAMGKEVKTAAEEGGKALKVMEPGTQLGPKLKVIANAYNDVTKAQQSAEHYTRQETAARQALMSTWSPAIAKIKNYEAAVKALEATERKAAQTAERQAAMAAKIGKPGASSAWSPNIAKQQAAAAQQRAAMAKSAQLAAQYTQMDAQAVKSISSAWTPAIGRVHQYQAALNASKNQVVSLRSAVLSLGSAGRAGMPGALGNLNTALGQYDDSKNQYQDLSNGLGGVRTAGMVTMGAAAAGAGAIGYGVGLAATKEAQLKAIEALSGSKQTAEDTYNVADHYALVSVSDLPQLVSASKTLTAARIFSERNLKAVDNVAAVSRGSENEVSANQAAFALSRLQNGDFGEGFQRFRELGVNRKDLEAEGLKFDGSGQFMGTTEQAVEGVVKVIEKKFGNLSETLATESLEGAWSNAGDAVKRLATSLGEELVPTLTAVTRAVTGVVGWFGDLPEPIKKVIAWGGVAAVALLGVAGAGMVMVSFVGQAYISYLALSGQLALTSAAAVTAGASVDVATFSLGGLAIAAGTFALFALAAIGVIIGAYLVWKKYADEIANPTSTVTDARTGDQAAADAANAQKVRDTVTAADSDTSLNTADKLQIYRESSKKLSDLGDSDAAEVVMKKRAELMKTAAGQKALNEGKTGLHGPISPGAQKYIDQFKNLADNSAARLTAVDRPKQDDSSSQLDAIRAQMQTQMNGGPLPVATAAGTAGAAARAGVDLSSGANAGAAGNIEQLEDQIAATDDRQQRATLRDQLRLARRAEKHANAAERDQKKADREAMANARLEAQVKTAEVRGSSSIRLAEIKRMQREKLDGERDGMQARIEAIRAQQQAGLITSQQARAGVTALRNAFKQRERALRHDSETQANAIKAQAIMAQAQATAAGQKGPQAKATLAIAKAKIAALGGQGGTSSSAEALPAGPASFSPLDYLRSGGSVFDFAKKKPGGGGAEATSGSGGGDRFIDVPVEFSQRDAGGGRIILNLVAKPIVIDNPLSRALKGIS